MGSVVKGSFANDVYNQSEKWKLNLTNFKDSVCLMASHLIMWVTHTFSKGFWEDIYFCSKPAAFVSGVNWNQ